MQIITEIPDGKPGRPDYQGSWFLKRQPGRDLPKKTEVATGRKRNAFLTGKVPSIATDYYMESQTDETEKNLTTSENFDFLYLLSHSHGQPDHHHYRNHPSLRTVSSIRNAACGRI